VPDDRCGPDVLSRKRNRRAMPEVVAMLPDRIPGHNAARRKPETGRQVRIADYALWGSMLVAALSTPIIQFCEYLGRAI
jgi:hypothetical protein